MIEHFIDSARCLAVTPVAWWLAFFASVAPLSGIVQAEDLPRYKLKVGEELVYRSTTPPKEFDLADGSKSTSSSVCEWTFHVVRENNDASFRLVFLYTLDNTRNYVSDGKRKEEHSTSSADGYFDLWPDGRVSVNDTIRPQTDPTVLFPLLPPDSASMQTSWEAKPPVDDARSTLRAQHDSSADRNSWNFVEDRRLPVDVLYRMSNHRDYEFDRELGTIRKVTTDLKTAWPPGREPTSDKQTFELTGTRQLGAAELRALSDEADCYWTAIADYKKLVSRADTEPGSAIGWFEKGESILKQLSGQITLPSLQAMLDRKLSQHRQDRAYMLPQYHRAAAILGKPSPDWQTTDLDGKPHALTDYRGKVVMLDFWIPGCGWCVRAMPQIKQLVADFEGQDVAIFGVNRDQNEQEARFVIETMKLNYNTLNDLHGSARISTQYKIITYPSLLLVDRKGIVRHVRLSYSPTLRQDVGENIRGLLAEKEQ